MEIWRKKDLSLQIMEKAEDSLKLDYDMYLTAKRDLRGNGPNKNHIDVYNSDKEINQAEMSIRRKVLTHLAASGKDEINSGLVLTSIVVDIERIGDYTKNIEDLAEEYNDTLDACEFEDEVCRIEKIIEVFFKKTIIAFTEADKATAKFVTDKYQKISGSCYSLITKLIHGEIQTGVSDAVTLALYLRYLKRTGAHLHNICSSIVNPFHKIGFRD